MLIFMIYMIDVVVSLGKTGELFMFMSGLIGIFATVFWAIGRAEGKDDDIMGVLSKTMKQSIKIFIVSLFITTFIPSKTTMQVITGAIFVDTYEKQIKQGASIVGEKVNLMINKFLELDKNTKVLEKSTDK